MFCTWKCNCLEKSVKGLGRHGFNLHPLAHPIQGHLLVLAHHYV